MSSSVPYVTFRLPFFVRPASSETAPAISLSTKDCSSCLLATGKQEMFFPRRCFPAVPGCASSPVPWQDFGHSFAWGRRAEHPKGTAGNRKNSVEISGVGLSQHLQNAQISPRKSQAESWLAFYKVLQFGALTAAKRQKKKVTLWWWIFCSPALDRSARMDWCFPFDPVCVSAL